MANKNPQESGRIIILSMGYFFLCVILIMGVATISSIYLERKSLILVSDMAAHYAANQLNLDQYYINTTGGKYSLELTDDDIARSLDHFVSQAPQGYLEFANFHIEGRVLPAEGNGAEITARATVTPTFLGSFLEGLNVQIPIEVSSRALPIDRDQ